MSNQGPHIEYEEIAAYLAGEGSIEERRIVEEWVKESEENRLFFEKCQNVFDLDFSVIKEEALAQPEFDSGQAWVKVYSKLDLSEGTRDLPIIDPSEDIPELEDDNVIELDSDKRTAYPWVRIAAVFVIVLGAVFALLNRSANRQITLAATDTVQEYYLKDSTRIVLESGASLSHRNNFGKTNREVDLTGKAYFDVTRNEDLAFIINTASGKIEVLGTAFVVEENNDSLYVIVERGKVQLSSISSGDYLILQKNEKGLLDLETFELEKSLLENVNELYWANNRLTYRQQGLESVFNELSEIFNMSIEYDPVEIENCRMTAVFMQQSFEEIMKNMALSMDFEYQIDGNNVLINSNGCAPE